LGFYHPKNLKKKKRKEKEKETRPTSPKKPKKKKKPNPQPARPSRGSRWPAMGLLCTTVGLDGQPWVGYALHRHGFELSSFLLILSLFLSSLIEN
jgi:hypothetical protein